MFKSILGRGIGTTALIALFSPLLGCEAASDVVPAAQAWEAAPAVPAVLVEVALVKLGNATPEVVVAGTLAPKRSATLSAETAARVRSASYQVGDVVTRGDTLIRLDSSKHRLAARRAGSAVKSTSGDIDYARAEERRMRQLFERDVVSRVEYDAAKNRVSHLESGLASVRLQVATARRELQDTVIKAPFSGVVSRKLVEEGEFVTPGRPVMAISDVATMKITLGVGGSQISRLRTGGAAKAHVVDLGGREIQTEITSIAPNADPETGLFSVELKTDNEDRSLRGGMVVRVVLPASKQSERLVVPRSALVRRSGASHVFVLEGDTAHLRRVRVGLSDESIVELEGVKVGERVVVSNTHALAPGGRARSATPSSAPVATP